ncbi:hypothetical protein Barb4_01105 [Bacteroidales bacterium Barb4]|nr:hypothetical protein Barb4_01105 [Bacteroidales bacterium Barb4]
MQRSGMWGQCEANALKGQKISAPHAAQRNVGSMCGEM